MQSTVHDIWGYCIYGALIEKRPGLKQFILYTAYSTVSSNLYIVLLSYEKTMSTLFYRIYFKNWIVIFVFLDVPGAVSPPSTITFCYGPAVSTVAPSIWFGHCIVGEYYPSIAHTKINQKSILSLFHYEHTKHLNLLYTEWVIQLWWMTNEQNTLNET